MKFSIITVCYNSEKTISDTLNSVDTQKGVDVEHIIIDGSSKDNTLNIINKYKSNKKNVLLISEKDKGIFDAMNKGMKLATGDIICILNSDDVYYDSYVLSKISKVFQDSNLDCVYTDLVFSSESNLNNIKRYWKSNKGSISKGWLPPHLGVYIKREFVSSIGEFNLKYGITSDTDFLIRMLLQKSRNFYYLNIISVIMRLGGTSTRNLRNIFTNFINTIKIYKDNGFKYSLIPAIGKLLRKIPQKYNIKKKLKREIV